MSTQGFAVLDLETTGIFANGHDRIIEVAVVRLDDGGGILDEYVTLVNPKRDIGPTWLHGISAGDVLEAPTFEEIAGDVLSLMRNAVLVGHQLRFDIEFMTTELNRIGAVLPPFPFLCTMNLASLLTDCRGSSRKLAALCEHCGIPVEDCHSALADAKMSAKLFGFLRTKLGDLSGRVRWSNEGTCESDWPSFPPCGKRCTRGHASSRTQPDYIGRLLSRLSLTTTGTRERQDYLAILDRALEDRRLTDQEMNDLIAIGVKLGMSAQEAMEAHRDYLTDLAVVAYADGVITDLERADLDEVRSLLGIPAETFDDIMATVRQAPVEHTVSNEMAGKTICFTGESRRRINGELVTRAMAEAHAKRIGMIVKGGVTKSLDYLVVADPDTLSGKARKAREYGVRILSEAVFWSRTSD